MTQMGSPKKEQRKKATNVKAQELSGQIKLNSTVVKKKWEPLTRDARLQVLKQVHGSSRMFGAINKPPKSQTADVISHLAHVKQTSYSAYKPTMGSTIAPVARKPTSVVK